ncbi:replicative DNA helicase [Rhizorhabdus wittichii]|uniref:Replicative DNA helicase n=2 Tax=Rhizorhabdus wittichii TaxID=160791 RepID=A0A9J9LFF7_RHIWR|nr:replicative DNA helicase [Rhizorhabdus wittichii]ABQ70399.1 replicative DNA helicase [Rhizorhabdus wittichii RW1]ARR52649.1 replicative DNA helicase [Rhizorhabdus wittichii DC-6]QTH24056.1 replicative DNA helicase [Rhizorhabdus wittichii]
MVEPVSILPPAPGEPPALPHNVEAEAALLGAMMLDNRIVEDIQIRLRPEHFFEPLHGRVYEAILRMLDRNMLATPVTLRPMFEGDASMRELGGPAYLAQLTGSGAALIGARDFANQIYDLALLRALVAVGRGMVEGALDTSEEVDPKSQIEQAEIALYKVAEEGGEEGSVKSFGQATKIVIETASAALNSGGHVAGLTTGLERLNAKIGGLHPSDLIILAGRPGMGKTSLATNIAFNVAQRYIRDQQDGIAHTVGAPVAFFSLEMSADQLAGRVLSEQAEISSEQIRMGKMSHAEFATFARAAQDLENLPLYIDDTPGLTIAALRTRARRLKRQRGIGCIMVDYLQLLQGSGRNSDGNRVQEISEISRGLKTLAKELSVPVIALSQLSRAVEQRENKKPVLSDLRESGSIEQDADMVWFVYREDYYLNLIRPKEASIEAGDSAVEVTAFEEWKIKMERAHNRAELVIAKQRHGSTGTIPLKFEARFTKFSDLADDYYGTTDFDD